VLGANRWGSTPLMHPQGRREADVMKLAGQSVLVTRANPSGAVKAMERQNADFLAPALVGSDQRNEGDEA
jgi:hypothetical protein